MVLEEGVKNPRQLMDVSQQAGREVLGIKAQ